MSLSVSGCSSRVGRAGAVLAILIAMWCSAALGQDDKSTPPKVEIFAGYSWLNPGGSIPTGRLPSISHGFAVSSTYNFNKFFGLTLDGSGHYSDFANVGTIMFGPTVNFRNEDGINFFLHTLGGLHRLSPSGLPTDNNLGALLGGGLDLPITRRFAWRVFEANYAWAHHNYVGNTDATVPDRLRRPNLTGADLRSGLVFRLGSLGPPPAPPTASCSAQPTEVMAGEPVTVTANPSGFNPKHTVGYNWTSTGGKVESRDTTARVDTTGMSPGSYTVTARATDARAKKNNEATCTANFTIKEPPKNPPTMSCSANPTTVQSGTPSTITCDCKSPDNVPVNVEYSASGGKVSGTGNTATLDTAGASPGPITVTGKCTDSRGLSASSDSTVTIEAPPPPPPQASKLNQCDFPNKVKPWRVDNTCKAVLDDVALRLQQQADSHLVIVGNQDPSERRPKNLAALRAVNSKAYLSGGEAKQQIDPSRIETRTGTAGGKTAEYWIVPAGAQFTEAGTTPVDESKVKAIPDHPRRAAGKRAAKKAKP